MNFNKLNKSIFSTILSTEMTESNNKMLCEETFFLLDLLREGSCMNCMNKTCKVKKEHGKKFPKMFSTFVKNPTFITGLSTSIDLAKFDFNGKKPNYTTCNFIHKKCLNCIEGRVKTMKSSFNDKDITLCYPSLNSADNKVTVGIHIDIKLVIKPNNNYEVSYVPIDVLIEEDIKEEKIEEKFYLLDLLNNGLCLKCLNKSCKINENHGVYIPEKISTFIKNPTFIPELRNIIDSTKFNFNRKKPFFTTCNYIHKKCLNCLEGRIKVIEYENKKIILCHNSLNSPNNHVTVGLHIDIKFVMKNNNNYDVSYLPLEIIEEDFDKIEELNKNEELNKSIDNWPSIIPNKSVILNKSVKDFSHIKNILIDENLNLEIKEDMNEIKEDINEHLKKDIKKDVKKDIKKDVKKDIKKDIKKDVKKDLKKDIEECIKEEINNFSIIPNKDIHSNIELNKSLEEEKLLIKVKILEEEIYSLKNDLIKSKLELERERIKIKNNDIYEEILYNINEINSRVSEDFLNTNYSDYLIL